LDTEADFDLHDLQQIVKHTDLFIFILSQGILDSFWCLQELRAAIENKKRILLVRDYLYQLPNSLPAHAQDLKDILTNSKEILYVAEYYQECVETIRKELDTNCV